MRRWAYEQSSFIPSNLDFRPSPSLCFGPIRWLIRSWMIGGDRNSMRCCVKVPCGKYYEKNYCRNKYKQPALFNAFHMYVHTFSNLAYYDDHNHWHISIQRSQSMSICWWYRVLGLWAGPGGKSDTLRSCTSWRYVKSFAIWYMMENPLWGQWWKPQG